MTEVMRQRIGTTEEGYLVVTVEIRKPSDGQTWGTVDHGTITDPVTLSFTGELYKHHTTPKRHDPIAAGQCREELLHLVKPAPGWTIEEALELALLWRRWHLNTMRAACAHMDTATLARETTEYGTRISTTDPRNACPLTGYMYGHAWLTEPVPADVLDRVRDLMRDRSDALYRARGYDAAGKAYPPAADEA